MLYRNFFQESRVWIYHQILLTSFLNCRNYGPNKNFTKCDLDLGPTRTNVSNGTSSRDGEQLCQIILKSIHNCRSYGLRDFERTDGRMHTHTPNCYCDNYVSLTASGFDNKMKGSSND